MDLLLHNWCCFENLQLSLPKTGFCISDHNGAGKTSILSAVYTLHTGQSFLSQNLKSYILENKKYFGLTTENVYLNGQIQPSGRLKIKQEILSEWVKPFILTYNPLDNNLLFFPRIKKIDFLDKILTQFDLEYDKNLKKLNKAVQSKQNLIKQTNEGSKNEDIALVKTLNQILFETSLKMWQSRIELVLFWQQNLNFIPDLNFNFKQFRLEYQITDESGQRQNLEKVWPVLEKSQNNFLNQLWPKELAAGRVLWGSGRDDFEIFIDNRPVIETLSRGQMRMLVLWLKYNTFSWLKEKNYPGPIWWLLDDAFGELDEKRELILVQNLLNQMDWFIITAANEPQNCPSFSIKQLEVNV